MSKIYHSTANHTCYIVPGSRIDLLLIKHICRVLPGGLTDLIICISVLEVTMLSY